MSFKVGQRVRYTGMGAARSKECMGWIGVVLNTMSYREDTKVRWDNGYEWVHLIENLELCEPLSALEQSIAAYVAQEKKELGLV